MARPALIIRRSIALLVSLAVAGGDSLRKHMRLLLNLPVAGRGVVLYYHAVGPRDRAAFSRQMDEILKRAQPFEADSREAMADAARNVAITFDDGYRSVLENAIPELEKRNMPFTIFVPTGCLGERPSWVRNPDHP